MKEISIPIKQLIPNTGQIEGIPTNPRTITEDEFERLKTSIQSLPELLKYRPLIVIPYNGKYVVIAGNMRYEAALQLGHKTISCKIIDTDTDKSIIRQWLIKDNVGYGQNDYALLAEWDKEEIFGWLGFDIASHIDTSDIYNDNEPNTIRIELSKGTDKDKLKQELKDALAEYADIKIK